MKRVALLMALLLPSDVVFASSLTDCIIKYQHCEKLVGKRLWVLIPPGNPNVVEITYKRGDWTTSRTLKLRTGASFVVTGLDVGAGGLYDFKVRLDNGRVGWAGRDIFLVDYDPIARAKAAQEECVRRGQPKIGMTPAELVETCWRRPLRIVKRTTAAGVEELYVYSRGRQIRLTDGKVSEIIEAR